ncbi:peptidylprolyl isomerase [Porticoccus sp. W117]|uniref:peptidylprolyl isomerase n=1 Tax=Porticoccus sp. W117 TaxID=3054777 RepID=UPI002599326C|nr:peptidylprolyl isomerase [Porticoccus sp. W117]MDM3870881.1 peptidylprolyl isomerase [Porticoccus sp. W117]
MATSSGDIGLLINAEKAPLSAQNVLDYVNAGHYNNTLFHRVISDFMIQGGGHNPDMSLKQPRPNIANESDNGLSNKRGTLAMARKRDPHSANAQFFINLVDNTYLDHKGTEDGWGYTVFGEVISGMEVVDAIAVVETDSHPLGMRDVPVEPVVIEHMEQIPCPPQTGAEGS